MTLLEHGQRADTTTTKHRTGLIAVLAILAVALLAAGVWLIVDRQQQPMSAEEQQAAIMDEITAHRDALEAGDRDPILATLTDDATALYLVGDGETLVISRDDYGLPDGERLTFIEDPVFLSDMQVAIRTRAELPGWFGQGGSREGTYLFTLREVDGRLKIASIVFAMT